MNGENAGVIGDSWELTLQYAGAISDGVLVVFGDASGAIQFVEPWL